MLLNLFLQLHTVRSSAYEYVLFKAAFALAFFGALRIGELVSASRTAHGGLLEGDVELWGDEVRVWVRRSKTDQEGKGMRLSLFRVPDATICPVRAVEHFCSVRPGLGGSFLVHQDGSALSRFQFLAVFRKCVVAAGYNPREYATHSFRIGAATEAARAGLDAAAVKRIERWDSDRFRIYVRPQLLHE